MMGNKQPPNQPYPYNQPSMPPYMTYYYPHQYYNMQPRRPNQPENRNAIHGNLHGHPRESQIPHHPPPFYDPRCMPPHAHAGKDHSH